MSLFQKIADWLFASVEKDLRNIDKDIVEEKSLHPMVGEPVISFLDSLEREPHRYRCRMIKPNSFTGKIYPWMTGCFGYYRLLDRKTGQVYESFVYGERNELKICQIVTIPEIGFSFNGWEQTAILQAFMERYANVNRHINERKRKVQEKERVRKYEQEKELKLDFAKQFQ